jgi:orotidine-5'-phosphate decarboxylase
MNEKQRNAARQIVLPLDTYSDFGSIHKLLETVPAQVIKVGYDAIYGGDFDFLLGKLRRKHPEVEVFLDVKFAGIGNTNANATKRLLAQSNLRYLNVHANNGVGGVRAVRQVLDAYQEENPEASIPKLLGLTILTSISKEEAERIYNSPFDEAWVRLANLALDGGVDGLICSPADLELLHQKKYAELAERIMMRPDFEFVCPGVRPEWAAADDQKRITTPARAIDLGATKLVIGRPILQAENPGVAFERCVEEIAQALSLGTN